MLSVLACIFLISLFYASFDVSPFKLYVEHQLKEQLQADVLHISKLEISWQDGFKIDFGLLTLETSQFSVRDTYTEITYTSKQLFQAGYAPELMLRGGRMQLNMDAKATAEHLILQPLNVSASIQDVDLAWISATETLFLHHLKLAVLPYQRGVSGQADGIALELLLREDYGLQSLDLKVDDFSMFPKSWLQHVKNLDALKLALSSVEEHGWQWTLAVQAGQGLIAIDKAKLQVPFSEFTAEGKIQLQARDRLLLEQLEVTQFKLENDEGFFEGEMGWQEGLLHVAVTDGATVMPRLWSWLHALGGEPWQQWLDSMQYGWLDHVSGTLTLPWQQPFIDMPKQEALEQMLYEVQANIYDADIALGLGGDFLLGVEATVDVNQEGLKAEISKAVLRDGIAEVHGSYAIAWNSLLMDIKAQGKVDVGKLHSWLDESSAKAMGWGSAPAVASMTMQWNVERSVPDVAKVYLKPMQSGWTLQPKNTSLHIHRGVAIWDIHRGLNLKRMRVKTPWLTGDVSMYLNKNTDWSMDTLHLDAVASLQRMTEEFSLPIVDPKGVSKLVLDFDHGKWRGALNFTESAWQSFAGYHKDLTEVMNIHISGKQMTTSILPIQIEHMSASNKGFHFNSSVLISEDKLDFYFKDIKTPALEGMFRLLLPLNLNMPWGLEAKVDYINKVLLEPYLKETENVEGYVVRPWSVILDAKHAKWDKSTAENVYFKFSSRKQSAGQFSAKKLASGDVNLENIKASFTILDQGKIDLHLLEADGSAQHLSISGSVRPKKTGILQWQGLVFMQGQFGRLMQQAELDQLFQEGEMTALFLGKGEFAENEPWWRGMEGSFRLRVDDGLVMEGGTLTHLLAAFSLIDLPRYMLLRRDDVTGEGLLYKKMQIEAEFDEEILHVNKLIFRSSALDASGSGLVDLSSGVLDMLLVARPWQNIEAILSAIPVVGYILTGEDRSLLRKVYRIHGPASDAAVDEVSPEDAGLPRSGLIEGIFSLPGELLEEGD